MNSYLTLTIFAVLALNANGAFYTRWGRTSCPSGATLIYTGFMAGSFYSHQGGGSNYICMHETPKVNERLNSKWETGAAYLHGVEYQLERQYAVNKQPFSFENNWGANLHDNNAPCAVCYKSTAFEALMIPGRDDCGGTDMVPEYTGFLMANYYGHAGKTEFICVDEAPEGIRGGQANENGALLYPAQLSKGSMSIPPYVEGNEVLCAVCTL